MRRNRGARRGATGTNTEAPFRDRGAMCDNETRSVERWFLIPRTDAEIYHPASHDQRSDLTVFRVLEGLDLRLRLPGEHPLVQALTAVAHRFFGANVRPSNVPVQ